MEAIPNPRHSYLRLIYMSFPLPKSSFCMVEVNENAPAF